MNCNNQVVGKLAMNNNIYRYPQSPNMILYYIIFIILYTILCYIIFTYSGDFESC